MKKTIFLILTILTTLRVSAGLINIPTEDGYYLFDSKITIGPGSDLPDGTVINGQMGGEINGIWVDIYDSIEFDFYDPNNPLHKQHQVARDGYTDWAIFNSIGGGYLELIGNHPRHPNYYHELDFNIDGDGNAYGFIRGGPCFECPEPDIDVDVYNHDFTGKISFTVHKDATNVPETSSTLGLMASVFTLLVAVRKRFAVV